MTVRVEPFNRLHHPSLRQSGIFCEQPVARKAGESFAIQASGKGVGHAKDCWGSLWIAKNLIAPLCPGNLKFLLILRSYGPQLARQPECRPGGIPFDRL